MQLYRHVGLLIQLATHYTLNLAHPQALRIQRYLQGHPSIHY